MASDDKAAELARQRFYIDMEFIESGPHRPITLISIGIVSDDGREFYAENGECPWDEANEWVKANVYPHLKGGAITRAAIRDGILKFVGDAKPEFWGCYADYDWVVFCQIFGAMVDLPKGWPMYCRDIKQLCDSMGNPQLLKQDSTEHNALNDARWNKEVHTALLRPHLSASDVSGEREAFEKWAAEHGLSLSILRNQFYEGYGDNATKRAWEAWQARAARRQIAPST